MRQPILTVDRVDIQKAEVDCISMETDIILRAILMQVKGAKNLKQAIARLESMCSKDIIAAVDSALIKEQESLEESGG